MIPFILKNLKPLIICALKWIIQEKLKIQKLTLESLLVNVNIREETKDKITKAMGNVKDAAGKVGTALNKVNLPVPAGGLGNSKKGETKDGKFCD